MEIDLCNGDSKEVLREYDDECIDMVLTDPPYFISNNNIVDTQSLLSRGQVRTKGFMGKEWDGGVVEVVEKANDHKWIKVNGRYIEPENIDYIKEQWQQGLRPAPVYKKKIDLFYEFNKMWMKEAYRVLEPGAFAIIMCSARQDLQSSVVQALREVGFNVNFSPIYWTYCDGFPKALNISKTIDKRAGKERKIIKKRRVERNTETWESHNSGMLAKGEQNFDITEPATEEAKEFEGAFGGFQPKPAVEVCLVAMKPLSEKTYVDQALANGKGVSWLGDCRIPTREKSQSRGKKTTGNVYGEIDVNKKEDAYPEELGRYPANLLVSDDAINDGEVTKSKPREVDDSEILKKKDTVFESSGFKDRKPGGVADSGSKSRYFDLDRWAVENRFPQEDLFGNRERSMIDTLPFMLVPKPSRRERDKGLDGLPDKDGGKYDQNDWSRENMGNTPDSKRKPVKNDHVTVKPVKLLGFLATMFTRKGDVICDPFMGSGSTGIACKIADRSFIGIEMDEHSFDIAKERIEKW